MILSYREDDEDLIFAISYLTLSIDFQVSTDFTLKVQDNEFHGVENVLKELIELCKCDPHDLKLLNDDVCREIIRIRKMLPRKVLCSLLQRKTEKPDQILPSNIPLNNYLNGERFTMADLVLFARVYKSIKEGIKYTIPEKEWFDDFQKQLLKLMDFKELYMIDFELFDIRVGKIVDIVPHENADSLYIEQVDLGYESPVQILSGLVQKCTIEDLKGKHFLFMINLKKTKLRGQFSHGMILCAKNENEFEVLKAPIGIPGEKLYLSGEKKPVIRTFNIPKIDAKSDTFIELMSHLKIKNNKLMFMDKVVLVGQKEITSSIQNADVS